MRNSSPSSSCSNSLFTFFLAVESAFSASAITRRSGAAAASAMTRTHELERPIKLANEDLNE